MPKKLRNHSSVKLALDPEQFALLDEFVLDANRKWTRRLRLGSKLTRSDLIRRTVHHALAGKGFRPDRQHFEIGTKVMHLLLPDDDIERLNEWIKDINEAGWLTLKTSRLHLISAILRSFIEAENLEPEPGPPPPDPAPVAVPRMLVGVAGLEREAARMQRMYWRMLDEERARFVAIAEFNRKHRQWEEAKGLGPIGMIAVRFGWFFEEWWTWSRERIRR